MGSIMAGVYARLEALERTDSAWLTSVMAPFTPVTFGLTTVAAGGWANVSGSSAGFSLTARPAHVLVIADLNAHVTGTNTAFARVAIDGAYAGGAQPVFYNTTSPIPATMIALSGVLAIGSHTATIQGLASGTDTLNVYSGDTLVFLLGA